MTDQGSTSPDRLALLEGLRGFLALYVVLDHTLEYSGYVDELAQPLFFLRAGRYAVDEFVILSGFVIYYLLDKRSENYRGRGSATSWPSPIPARGSTAWRGSRAR